MQENGVREAHEVPTRQGGVPSKGGRALHPRGGLVSFPDYFLLSKILKYSKTEKKMSLELFWSRFTYRTTYLFLFGV